MKNLIYLLIIIAASCCPKKNCLTYEKQVEACKKEKSNLKAKVDYLKMENITLMDSINRLHKEINILVNDLNFCDEMLGYNDEICDSSIKQVTSDLTKKINSIKNALEYCNEVYNNDIVKLSECNEEKELLNDRISELLIEIGRIKTEFESFQIDNNNLKFTNQTLWERLRDALFFVNDTVYKGDEAFYVIDDGTLDLDTVKIYFTESIYHIVDYIFKNDTIRKYQNDFINEQNTIGQTVLLIEADSVYYPSPVLNVMINDTLYSRSPIDNDVNIVHILKSYEDIDKIELELTNNVRTIIYKIGLNRFEMDSLDVISPAYVDDDRIIMEEAGAKIIINK